MTKHGHACRAAKRSPTYNSWRAMIGRCHMPGNTKYPSYGGRGIKVCKRWRGKDGFKNFLKDMGLRPEGLTLDRKINELGYSKGNCRWATASQQRLNQIRYKNSIDLSNIDF